MKGIKSILVSLCGRVLVGKVLSLQKYFFLTRSSYTCLQHIRVIAHLIFFYDDIILYVFRSIQVKNPSFFRLFSVIFKVYLHILSSYPNQIRYLINSNSFNLSAIINIFINCHSNFIPWLSINTS